MKKQQKRVLNKLKNGAEDKDTARFQSLLRQADAFLHPPSRERFGRVRLTSGEGKQRNRLVLEARVLAGRWTTVYKASAKDAVLALRQIADEMASEVS